MTDPTEFTLIIPAHNEELVIARCLETALDGAPADCAMQVIVAANGCADRTVEIARATAPGALVLDLPTGSKPIAMNTAGEVARFFPRIYLDADVQCDFASLLALADVLRQPHVMVASPALRMDLSRSSNFIQSYYKVWLTQPYVNNRMVGSGCYGLSQAAADFLGPFPLIIGDDIWVHSRFRDEQRASVSQDANGRQVYFTVSPPRRVIDQIRVETRRRLGNRELMRLHPSPHYNGSNSAGDLKLALAGGASVLDLGIYLAIKLVARIRGEMAKLRGNHISWERDEVSRQA